MAIFPIMNVEWMRQKLTEYLEICDQIDKEMAGAGSYWTDACDRLNKQATLRLSTVEKVVRRLEPSVPMLMPPSHSSADSARFVRQALGALNDIEEVEDALAPESPSLEAEMLHELVWRAASTIWDTGEYRMAVQQAAVALSAHIKKRAGSPLTDRKLVQQVFSPDKPKPDQARLHLPGDPSEESWQSRQQGLQLIAQGAFAGIRNVAAHEDVSWTEHEGLEHLAVLSVVARWADETYLVTTE